MTDSGRADAGRSSAPALPSSTPSPTAHADPARYLEERHAVFGRHWLAVGDTSQVGEPGRYLAVEVAGFPVVVVNDGGRLRGFHNICRHRAGPLVWPGTGSCRSLVCRYHGWSYGLDGSLRSARDFGGHPPEGDLSLGAVAVDIWRGLVFVNLDPAAGPLLDWLEIIPARCADFPLEDFVPTHRSSHALAANWKVYAENYQEGYHIPLVHPGLNRQVDAGRYRVEATGSVAVHTAPARDGSVALGAWLWRFPGLALNLYPSGMCLESFWPTGPASTRVEYIFFFAPSVPPSEAQRSIDSSVAILEEDRVICEAVQRNLSSGLARPGPLSPRHEGGVALVQSLVEQALGTT